MIHKASEIAADLQYQLDEGNYEAALQIVNDNFMLKRRFPVLEKTLTDLIGAQYLLNLIVRDIERYETDCWTLEQK